jgi:hypothetical protein
VRGIAPHFFVRVAETFVTLVLFPFSVDGELPTIPVNGSVVTKSLHCVSFNPPLFDPSFGDPCLRVLLSFTKTKFRVSQTPRGRSVVVLGASLSPSAYAYVIVLLAHCIPSCDISGLDLPTADLRDLRI